MNILLSYYYYRKEDLDAIVPLFDGKARFFLDSGAFSAKTLGGKIDLEQYAAWVQRWEHLRPTYANLDVIGDPQATERNQQRLEAMGLQPLPIFHVGSPFAILRDYVARYPYVALGGMVPYTRRKQLLIPWVAQCFKVAEKAQTRFHGFGCTTWELIHTFPWHSVDSSSWTSGPRWGTFYVFNPTRGGFMNLDLGNFQKAYNHAAMLRGMGIDPAIIAKRGITRGQMLAIAASAYQQAEAWLRERRKHKGLPEGPSIYLANGGINDLVYLKEGLTALDLEVI